MRARRKTNSIDNAKANRAFAKGVLERDGYVCRMEQWFDGDWYEHGIKGSPNNPIDPAHIYARANCGGAWSNPIVGLAACRNCHNRYDRNSLAGPPVRVPPAREVAAYAVIQYAVTKFTVPRRRPPDTPEVRA
jgi:hypothetical protein